MVLLADRDCVVVAVGAAVRPSASTHQVLQEAMAGAMAGVVEVEVLVQVVAQAAQAVLAVWAMFG